MKNSDFFSRLERDFSALYETGLLDSAPEPAFDRITRIVARALDVPISLLTFVDKERQFFKSHCGLPEPVATDRETPLRHSFCQHVVMMEHALVVENSQEHPLVHNNPSINDYGIMAYLGVPVEDGRGRVIGSLCALDFRTREWHESDLDVLEALAAQVSSEIDLRLAEVEYQLELEGLHRTQRERQRMARYIVNDLRLPLRALHLNIQTLKVVSSLSEEQLEYLELSSHNITTLQNTVNELMGIELCGVSAPLRLEYSDTSPVDLVHFAVGQVRAIAESKEVKLEQTVMPNLPTISVDKDRLVRVLVNMIGQALNHSPAGGSVRVAADLETHDGGTWFTLTVSDDGHGMKPKELELMLQPTETSHAADHVARVPAGSLVHCRRVIEAHGGTIMLDSEPGVGSLFTVMLPVADS